MPRASTMRGLDLKGPSWPSIVPLFPNPFLKANFSVMRLVPLPGSRKREKRAYSNWPMGGPLLLDEISELPFNLQSRLLRVIEEREVQPIGDDRVIPVEVRIIATTNRDLSTEVDEKRFRGDLFYRLNVLQFNVPPLGKGGKDAYLLFKTFHPQAKPEMSQTGMSSTRRSRGILGEHPWPGNVREVRNLVERLAHLTENFTQNLVDSARMDP